MRESIIKLAKQFKEHPESREYLLSLRPKGDFLIRSMIEECDEINKVKRERSTRRTKDSGHSRPHFEIVNE